MSSLPKLCVHIETDNSIQIPTAETNYTKSQNQKKGAHCLNSKIFIKDSQLLDDSGRSISLRGVNLSGNSKLPVTPLGAALPGTPEFFDHRNVSFVGRPFTPSEAHEHFERLSNWGLTFARILVPWEALEHKGAGIYDEEYIDSLIKVLSIAVKYGIKCFIDPHQDTWSRYSGGSGAPGWTFEVVGLDITNFRESGAAHYHDFEDEKYIGTMIWPTNYLKLASATMFTVFFGGDEFAPNSMYQGVSCQEYLVSHYLNCYKHLALRLKNCEAVIGFEAMNEPHPGYIGMPDLTKFDTKKDLRLSSSPLPLQSFELGMGGTVEVEYWVKSWPQPSKCAGSRMLNNEKVSAWLPNRSCIWKEHGIWEYDKNGKAKLKKYKHFTVKKDGSPVHFKEDFYAPFLKKFAAAVREGNPDLFFFFEPVPNEDPPNLIEEKSDWLQNSIYSPHWYDLNSVFHKSFTGYITHDVQGLSRGTRNVLQASYFGIKGAFKNYSFQVSNVVKIGLQKLGKMPCLIGECGIPMDINEKAAFESGNYTHHTNFLNAMNMVHFTLWNYNPNNDNVYGDFWNGEDFSIFSKPKKSLDATSPKSNLLTSPTSAFDLIETFFNDANAHHVGGRALDAVIRPYAARTAGATLFSVFDLDEVTFELVFITPKNTEGRSTRKDANISEIFIPQFHFELSMQPEVVVSDGDWLFDPSCQTIYWTINPEETTPMPFSMESPDWMRCPKSVVTKQLLETHNFHTLQVYKSKVLTMPLLTPSKRGCIIS